MTNFITEAISIFKKWVIITVILAGMLMLYSNSYVNDLNNQKVDAELSVETTQFTPEYVGTAGYWLARDHWYKVNCPGEHKIDMYCESRQYTHAEYMEHKFGKLHDRKERLANGDTGGFMRFINIF